MRFIIFGIASTLLFHSCTAKRLTDNSAPDRQAVRILPPVPVAQVVDFQKEFLRRINLIRAEGCKCGNTYMPPVPALTWNTNLQLSALGHAQDMARNKYFSHVSKNGAKIKERITAAGYTYEGFQSFTIGENIAFNQRTIREVMEGWLNSPSHCKNIMSPSFQEVGIAMQNYYWVQDFGARIPFTKKAAR